MLCFAAAQHHLASSAGQFEADRKALLLYAESREPVLKDVLSSFLPQGAELEAVAMPASYSTMATVILPVTAMAKKALEQQVSILSKSDFGRLCD